ncbi:glycosyltransferase family A protein [Kitasatospora paranensis]|uniref:glycosyltransferase family A protein n=1 Tax=Kitasatospora paranensis TaxID=258053 RepID=UPI0031F18014
MNGVDRRTAAACPRTAARDSLYTPVRVVELDLDEPGELRSPGGLGPADPDGRVLALVRLHGHPLGLVTATGTAGDPATLRRALVDAAHRELRVPSRSTATPAAQPRRVGRARARADRPTVTVVICTRNRPRALRRCLDSLLRTDYPDVEVLVVDNAPLDDTTRELVRTRYRDQVRYLREPVPGLARARNTGLAAARGEICAFADDDLVIDSHWVAALAEAFEADDRTGCVTGLVMPAELDTAAQLALERYGGYSRGFAARSWSLREPPTTRWSGTPWAGSAPAPTWRSVPRCCAASAGSTRRPAPAHRPAAARNCSPSSPSSTAATTSPTSPTPSSGTATRAPRRR